ncbi:MAG TPA: hypothetical protein VK009_28850 [Chloroflexota bacterium]|nr:hypothetical protein [Chloroflexota bacterium]
MSETRARRYVVMGEGVTVTGETLEEARARYRDLTGERQVAEPVRIPVTAPERVFEGERFLESIDVLSDVRRTG